jgi:hypothetical protein
MTGAPRAPRFPPVAVSLMTSGGPKPLLPIPHPPWLGLRLGLRLGVVERDEPGGGDDPGPPPAVKVTLAAVKALLMKSAAGSAAVRFFEARGLRASFTSASGSAWDGEKIIIDKGYSVERAALAFVHEVYHARAELEGRTADILRLSRADYVAAMLDEEVRATLEALKANRELSAGGVPMPRAPGQDLYRKGQIEGVKAAVDPSRPTPDGAVVEAAIEKAVYAGIMQAFLQGDIKSSRSNKTYEEKYGSAWDRYHPGKG